MNWAYHACADLVHLDGAVIASDGQDTAWGVKG